MDGIRRRIFQARLWLLGTTMLRILTHILDRVTQLGARFFRDGVNGHAVGYLVF